jgi:hypothetical protein
MKKTLACEIEEGVSFQDLPRQQFTCPIQPTTSKTTNINDSADPIAINANPAIAYTACAGASDAAREQRSAAGHCREAAQVVKAARFRQIPRWSVGCDPIE